MPFCFCPKFRPGSAGVVSARSRLQPFLKRLARQFLLTTHRPSVAHSRIVFSSPHSAATISSGSRASFEIATSGDMPFFQMRSHSILNVTLQRASFAHSPTVLRSPNASTYLSFRAFLARRAKVSARVTRRSFHIALKPLDRFESFEFFCQVKRF